MTRRSRNTLVVMGLLTLLLAAVLTLLGHDHPIPCPEEKIRDCTALGWDIQWDNEGRCVCEPVTR